MLNNPSRVVRYFHWSHPRNLVSRKLLVPYSKVTTGHRNDVEEHRCFSLRIIMIQTKFRLTQSQIIEETHQNHPNRWISGRHCPT